jgi:hypothetical protein
MSYLNTYYFFTPSSNISKFTVNSNSASFLVELHLNASSGSVTSTSFKIIGTFSFIAGGTVSYVENLKRLIRCRGNLSAKSKKGKWRRRRKEV